MIHTTHQYDDVIREAVKARLDATGKTPGQLGLTRQRVHMLLNGIRAPTYGFVREIEAALGLQPFQIETDARLIVARKRRAEKLSGNSSTES